MDRVLSINGHEISALEVVKAFIIKNFDGEDQTIAFAILTNCRALYEDALKSKGFEEFLMNDYLTVIENDKSIHN